MEYEINWMFLVSVAMSPLSGFRIREQQHIKPQGTEIEAHICILYTLSALASVVYSLAVSSDWTLRSFCGSSLPANGT